MLYFECDPQIHVNTLTPHNVTAFGEKAYKKVIKVTWDKVEVLIQ